MPASLSVWQPPQVAVNARLAGRDVGAPVPPLVVAAVVVSPPSPVDVVSAVVVAVEVSAVVAVEPPDAPGFTAFAVVPSPSVISPVMVVFATFDEKQPLATTATPARTRSSGKGSTCAHAE